MPVKTFKKGFTLIELLIVVSIIAILSGITLSVINVNRIRERSLYSVKKENLQTISIALERYYSDNNSYPPSGCPTGCSNNYINSLNTTSTIYQELINRSYLKSFPINPSHSPSNPNWYDYWVSSDLQNYCLCFNATNVESDSILNGCAAPNNLNTIKYYCIRNPF